jgi:nucleoid DNA-binding protein
MLSRKERNLLKEATDLIVRELKETGSVGLTGFGKFYVSEVETASGVHEAGSSPYPDKRRNVVRFRPWEGLKKEVNDGCWVRPSVTMVETPLVQTCVHCGAELTSPLGECSECGLPQEV